MRYDGVPTASIDCDHELRTHGRTGVIACAACGMVEWFGLGGRPLDPAEAMAALFGAYDLIGPVAAVGAPARRILAYRPNRGGKAALALLPRGGWLQAGPHLWLATDGESLLLATPDELMVENLTRGA
ncbi:MAG TPA: hypothetical protein VJ938_07855 [Acidimicrobiia bacterium]|jgi:hypothetical protein|nr:hypothetical protein [Acidimicrobiia bacterium]